MPEIHEPRFRCRPVAAATRAGVWGELMTVDDVTPMGLEPWRRVTTRRMKTATSHDLT
jgi:hypothetical protein